MGLYVPFAVTGRKWCGESLQSSGNRLAQLSCRGKDTRRSRDTCEGTPRTNKIWGVERLNQVEIVPIKVESAHEEVVSTNGNSVWMTFADMYANISM